MSRAITLLVTFVVSCSILDGHRNDFMVARLSQRSNSISGQEKKDSKFEQFDEKEVRFSIKADDNNRSVTIEGVRVCAGLSVAVIFSDEDFDEDVEVTDATEKLASKMVATLISKRRYETNSNAMSLKSLRATLGPNETKEFLKSLLFRGK